MAGARVLPQKRLHPIASATGRDLLQGILYTVLFLICVVIFAKVHSRRLRQAVLLVMSYALYLSWGRWFAAVLLASTVMNYLVGERLQRKPSGVALATGIFFNLTLLGSFKYLPEAAIHLPFSSLQRFSHLALPLGISFWTFQAMSYLFDLYRDEELNPSFFEFALYMVFFPVTISGPICRLPEMLPQFRSEQVTRRHEMGRGLRRIATGIFMVQLAKLLGQGILSGDGINSGFERLSHWSGTDVWCLAFGFGLQLFFDFAGYSHIAIGAAQAMGFTVPENFARPFQSTTPSVFWTRWHMSLSFWIRDYVFLPLAMLRREVWWRNFALVIAMVVFGLWHKASMLLLSWGCYHGVLLVLHRQVQWLKRRFDWEPSAWWTVVSWIATMALINLAWILFRANSLPQAGQMLSAVLTPESYTSHFLSGSLYALVLALALGYAIALSVIDTFDHYSPESQHSKDLTRRAGVVAFLARWRWLWIPPLYAVALLVLLTVTLTRGPSSAQFMYRRF